ncbi:MAG: excinuclease ABC subunit UvrC [Marinilabiliales bacterium]
MIDKKHIKDILQTLPEEPGVYQFIDKNNKIIYVGKAKNLKKRVSSYFAKNHEYAKLNILVSKIINIKYIIVDSESDALLLENNLIKEHQPRYNVMLKDDKTYPWICIKNERFPRVFKTRNRINDGSEYSGPYTSGMMIKTILELLRQLYPIRTCNYNLSEENIKQKKYKVCLEYHLKNCNGPCAGLQTEDDYNRNINEIRKILKGDIHKLIEYLKGLMYKFSDELNFEAAQKIKDKIDIIEKYKSKSTIVNPKINYVDVFSYTQNDENSYVNYMKVVEGAVIQSHNIELKKKLNETPEELLLHAIINIRQRFESESKEIIVPFPLNFEIEGCKITVPVRGDKKHLLDLSLRNALYYKKEKIKEKEKYEKKTTFYKLLETVKNDLRLKEYPYHIECFDNSNIQGSNPVAACVVFINLKPSKKDYRKYNIKTVSGINDFASMEEVVYRRYRRLLEEGKQLPQLIIIDGGKGQLNSAIKSLKKLSIEGKIAIIGIAKRLEEIYYPKDSLPLYLDKKSETLKLIQHIRNEAHRFGIGFHRDKRLKNITKSGLEDINGIGEKTIQKLIRHFKSIKKISDANVDDIEKIVGKQKALLIYNYFNSKK